MTADTVEVRSALPKPDIDQLSAFCDPLAAVG
jgi:hypothetical protein